MMREWQYTASSWDALGCTFPPTISLEPQDVPQASPLGHLSALSKYLGRRGSTTQFIPPLGSVCIQYIPPLSSVQYVLESVFLGL